MMLGSMAPVAPMPLRPRQAVYRSSTTEAAVLSVLPPRGRQPHLRPIPRRRPHPRLRCRRGPARPPASASAPAPNPGRQRPRRHPRARAGRAAGNGSTAPLPATGVPAHGAGTPAASRLLPARRPARPAHRTALRARHASGWHGLLRRQHRPRRSGDRLGTARGAANRPLRASQRRCGDARRPAALAWQSLRSDGRARWRPRAGLRPARRCARARSRARLFGAVSGSDRLARLCGRRRAAERGPRALVAVGSGSRGQPCGGNVGGREAAVQAP
jgi:hypothetical protein